MEHLHPLPGSSFRSRAAAPLAAGHVERVDGLGRGENAACGDRLELSLQVNGGQGTQGASIERAGYRAVGCSSLLASASLVCEHLPGLTLAQAGELDCAQFLAAAGGPPPRGAHAASVVARALAQALEGALAKFPR